MASFWPHFGSLDGSLDGCLIFHCFLMLFGSLFEPILAPFSIPKLIIFVIMFCMFFHCFSTPFFFNFTSIFQGDSHRHSSPNRNNSLRDFERLAYTRRSFSRIRVIKNHSKIFKKLSENPPEKSKKNHSKIPPKTYLKIIKKPLKMKPKNRLKKSNEKCSK